jgi:hypothetical protein
MADELENTRGLNADYVPDSHNYKSHFRKPEWSQLAEPRASRHSLVAGDRSSRNSEVGPGLHVGSHAPRLDNRRA